MRHPSSPSHLNPPQSRASKTTRLFLFTFSHMLQPVSSSQNPRIAFRNFASFFFAPLFPCKRYFFLSAICYNCSLAAELGGTDIAWEDSQMQQTSGKREQHSERRGWTSYTKYALGSAEGRRYRQGISYPLFLVYYFFDHGGCMYL